MTNYSNRIRELRVARSMNQEQLADALGLTKQAVSQYERGVRKPSVPVLEALCDFFNVSSDYLLGKDDVTLRYVDGEGIKKLDGVQNTGPQITPQWYINEETAKIAQEIYDDPNKRALFDAARDSRPEDLKMATDLLERFKETNPDG